MKQKLFTILLCFLCVLFLVACGAENETTLTGMVVSVDGTVISFVQLDTSNMGDRNFADGERPQKPDGMENGQNFNPGDFSGTLPEGETFPQWGEGERPQMPDGVTLPEDMTMPEDGSRPDDFGGNGQDRPGFENFNTDAETKKFDIGNAHISVEIDGGKASGSMDDIQPGAFVTLTLNGKEEATSVLVSSMSGFGGGRKPAN